MALSRAEIPSRDVAGSERFLTLTNPNRLQAILLNMTGIQLTALIIRWIVISALGWAVSGPRHLVTTGIVGARRLSSRAGKR
jgi:hypothetical protein